MRISWLTAEEIAVARQALTVGGSGWDDHFVADRFTSPVQPDGSTLADWSRITEHVARAERVSEVVRRDGLEGALARFAESPSAIEQATLAAAAHQADALDLERIFGILDCEVDAYVFYAPFLELMVALGHRQLDRAVATYERFVAAYATALTGIATGAERVGAMFDGLADYYVSAGRLDDADRLFERRHGEDRRDVAVALTASRAFLAAGSVSHAVRWLGLGALRASELGRGELAERLRQKQVRVRERLS